MARSDIEIIEVLFATIRSIHIKGLIGPYGEEGVRKEWVTAEDIRRNMERPKLKQPEIVDFCEYQVKRGFLESRTGKDRFVLMANSEYRMTFQGKQILDSFRSKEFQKQRDIVSWSRKNMSKVKRGKAKSKDKTNVTKEE